MNKLYNIAILLLTASIVVLLFFGIAQPWGTIVAISAIMMVIIAHLLYSAMLIKHEELRRLFYFPVLGFITLVFLGVLLLALEKKTTMTLVFILFAIGGTCGVLNWVVSKGYRKPPHQLWQDDLYILPWEADLVTFFVFLVDILKGSFSWVSIAIIILAVLDIANQFLMKRFCSKESSDKNKSHLADSTNCIEK